MIVLYTLSATAGIAGVLNFTRLMNTPIKDPEEAYERLYQNSVPLKSRTPIATFPTDIQTKSWQTS